MMDIIMMEKNMDQGSSLGAMGQFTMVNLRKTIYQELARIVGVMGAFIVENGKIITCMDREYICGLMAGVIAATTSKIKRMAMEFSNGLMEEDMRGIGNRVNKTV